VAALDPAALDGADLAGLAEEGWEAVAGRFQPTSPGVAD
jgi:hypothetical protein